MQNWDRDTVLKNLKESECKVIFTKTNGEQRQMRCTLKADLLPVASGETKRTKKDNPDIQPVFDLETNGWRSFRWDSLNQFEAVA